MPALFSSLREEFLDHVEELDRKYCPWVNEQGVN
jgi:hypothetical protein